MEAVGSYGKQVQALSIGYNSLSLKLGSISDNYVSVVSYSFPFDGQVMRTAS